MKRTNRINSAAAVLWASAFLLAALVIVQAGKLPANNAHAAVGVALEDFSMVTIDSGRGGDTQPDETLYVLDSRDEVLLIYEIEDARQKEILLRNGGSLQNLFRNARR
jgi:hypothetical protein